MVPFFVRLLSVSTSYRKRLLDILTRRGRSRVGAVSPDSSFMMVDGIACFQPIGTTTQVPTCVGTTPHDSMISAAPVACAQALLPALQLGDVRDEAVQDAREEFLSASELQGVRAGRQGWD